MAARSADRAHHQRHHENAGENRQDCREAGATDYQDGGDHEHRGTHQQVPGEVSYLIHVFLPFF
jgi:hypothetical protein